MGVVLVPGAARASNLPAPTRGSARGNRFYFWKKNLRIVFFTTLIADALVLGVVLVAMRTNPQWLIDQRFAIFSRPVSDEQVFLRSPGELQAAGFRSDSAELRLKWREKLLSEVSYLAGRPAEFDSWPTIKRAEWLASQMGHDGGENFPPGTLLVDKLNRLPHGEGVCSDHVEGFIALCSIFGIEAREVSTSVHTTAGVYLPEEHRWAWMDPEFALVARNSAGQLMTSAEMRDAMLHEKDFRLEYFGGDPARVMARINPHQHEYYNSPADFGDLVLTFGNNVFEFDEYRSGAAWMPRPVRQFVLLMLGIQPDYRFVDDKQSELAARIPSRRGQSLAIAFPLAIGTFAYPLFLVGSRLWTRARATPTGQVAMN